MTIVEVDKVEARPIVDRREAAIKAMVREGQCDRALAESTLVWIESMVATIRGYEDGEVYHLSDEELSSRCYWLLDTVMPHGRSARPGTAHAAIEELLLDPAHDELSLMHDMTGRRRVDCTVFIELSRPLEA